MKKILIIALLVSSIVCTNAFAASQGSSAKYLKRSEFAVMLHKALNISIKYFKAPDVRDYFSDVGNEDAFSASLIDLATVGIIDYRGSFRPNDTIPRDEFVHYIMNAYRYKKGLDVNAKNAAVCKFTDKGRINTKYLNDVVQAAGLGLVKGNGKNLFRPKDRITGVEASVVIGRLKKALDMNAAEVKVTPGYEIGKGVFIMKLRITNNSDTTVTINHSSGQKFDFALLDSDRDTLYRWSADKMFMMALGTTVINPGESVDFSGEVDMASYGDIIDRALYLKAFIVGESKDFSISSDGYETALKTQH